MKSKVPLGIALTMLCVPWAAGCNQLLGISEGRPRLSDACDGGCASITPVPEGCGNGVLGPGELCDGDCPTTCSDGIACTTDTLMGEARLCNAHCVASPIEICATDDGCCPAACDQTNDGDCSATCGNATIDALETCDGLCPTSCDDRQACTTDTLTGSASNCSATCSFAPIAACVSGDGCCPSACSVQNDSDCSATCGNTRVEPPETCDGNCPFFCFDGDLCTIDFRLGSPFSCSAICIHSQIDACQHDDGCCPQGCTTQADNDCPLPWTKRKELVVSAAQVEADGNGFLTSFPVLVSFNDADLAASARSDGRDIFFVAGDGATLLDFEVDSFRAGTLIAWVRMPALSATYDTHFYVYYGDGKAWDRQHPSAVWDATFAGVFHLSEDPGPGGLGDLKDSSGGGRHGTAPAAYTSADLVEGQVGLASELSSAQGSLDFGDIDDTDGSAQLTVSIWVDSQTIAQANNVVQKGADDANGWALGVTASATDLFGYVRVDGASLGPDATTTSGVVANQRMQLWTLVYNGKVTDESQRLALYIDAVAQPLSVRGSFPARTPSTAASVLLGGGFDGTVDELLLSLVARSKGWIATYYANVTSPETFVTRGAEERM